MQLPAPVLALVVGLLSCTPRNPAPVDASPLSTTRYLFAWTGDEDREQEDFLAVAE